MKTAVIIGITQLALAGSLCSEPAVAQSQSPAASANPAAPETRVSVSGFKIEGNTLLDPAVIAQTLDRYKGERTLDELRQAAQAVQALYGEAGYGAVLAFLPEQSSNEGTVTIRVAEGRLARISVSGNQQFSEANIRAGLPALVLGETPRLRRIDTQIQMVNENPAKQVQVLLQPGQAAGEVEAKVNVTEEPLQRWSLSLDNTGNENTGDLRASLGWQHANLTGRDDVLSAQFQASPDSPESVAVLTTGYRIPFYEQSLVVDAYAAYSNVDGGSTPTAAGSLQFNGKGHVVGVRASRYLPRWGEIDQRLSAGLDYRAYLNQCGIDGLPDGACGSAGESVSVLPLSLEYSMQRGGALPFGASLSLFHNLGAGNGRGGEASFEAVRTGAKRHYTVARFSVSAGMAFAEDWQVQARAAGQYTEDALVSGEQFGLGGVASVRGYEERELAGDRGVAATLEVIAPSIAKPLGLAHGDLRPLALADGGSVWNRLGTPCFEGRDHCSMASLGLGLRFDDGAFQARLYVANAMKAGPQTERHASRAHFSISYSF